MIEFRLMKRGGDGTYLTIHANHYFSTSESYVFVGPDMVESARFPKAEFTEVITVKRGEAPPPEGS